MELNAKTSQQTLENLRDTLRKLEESADPNDPTLAQCRCAIFRRIAYLEIDNAMEELPTFKHFSYA
jgi:hypothetical protein